LEVLAGESDYFTIVAASAAKGRKIGAAGGDVGNRFFENFFQLIVFDGVNIDFFCFYVREKGIETSMIEYA
jgi:hypothetical protein